MQTRKSSLYVSVIILTLSCLFCGGCTGRKAKSKEPVVKTEWVQLRKRHSKSPKDSIRTKPVETGRTVLPGRIRQYVADNLPEYSLVATDDYPDGWKRYVGDDRLPFFTSTDFNGDGEPDYALLLSKNEQLGLFVLNSQRNDSLTPFLLDKFPYTGNKVDAVLSIEKKGKWEGIDTAIVVKNDGISVSLMEESQTFSYYWNGKKYVKFYYD